MSDDREVTEDCIGFGFYSIRRDSSSLESFYGDLVKWFDEVACPPDRLALYGKGFGGKPVGYSRANARLYKTGFNQLNGFCVFAMLPEGVIPILDWWITAAVDFEMALKPYFAFAARTSVASLEEESVLRLMESCCQHLRPAYGIGFTRPHARGPWFYAAGMSYDTIGGDLCVGPPSVREASESLGIEAR